MEATSSVNTSVAIVVLTGLATNKHKNQHTGTTLQSHGFVVKIIAVIMPLKKGPEIGRAHV